MVAFGTDNWICFWHGLSQTEQALLSEGWAGWDKMQSLFAAASAHHHCPWRSTA